MNSSNVHIWIYTDHLLHDFRLGCWLCRRSRLQDDWRRVVEAQRSSHCLLVAWVCLPSPCLFSHSPSPMLTPLFFFFLDLREKKKFLFLSSIRRKKKILLLTAEKKTSATFHFEKEFFFSDLCLVRFWEEKKNMM